MPPETDRSPDAPGSLTVEDGVAWLVLDDPDERVNTLSSRMFGWFEGQLARLGDRGRRPVTCAVWWCSPASPGTFVAGADIEELEGLEDEAEMLDCSPAATP